MGEGNADTPKVIEVAERFHVRQEIDNIAWMDLGDFAVAVDALEHREKADDVFGAIDETLGDEPLRYMINTHTHYDHVALNDAFRERYGAEIVNMETTDIPADGKWFEGDRRRVLVRPMAGLHTDTDCILWVPADRVLFTGDLFGWGLIPLVGVLRDETAAGLMEVYTRMIDYDAETVIPGHGPLATSDHLRRFVDYFHDLRRQAAEGVAAGRSDKEIISSIDPPEDMTDWWRFVQWKHADSVEKVVRAVRRGRLSAPDG